MIKDLWPCLVAVAKWAVWMGEYFAVSIGLMLAGLIVWDYVTMRRNER